VVPGYILFEQLKKPGWASHPGHPSLLKKMVASDNLGNKTGSGFYDYTKDPKNPEPRAF